VDFFENLGNLVVEGLVGVEAGDLGNIGKFAGAGDIDFALVGVLDAGEDFQQRGFTGAVWRRLVRYVRLFGGRRKTPLRTERPAKAFSTSRTSANAMQNSQENGGESEPRILLDMWAGKKSVKNDKTVSARGPLTVFFCEYLARGRGGGGF
jgi:hypothetical protein